MATTAYLAVRMDGSITEHVSRDAAQRAAKRSNGSRTVVEIRRADERLPDNNDAKGWDAYRLRHGIAAR